MSSYIVRNDLYPPAEVPYYPPVKNMPLYPPAVVPGNRRVYWVDAQNGTTYTAANKIFKNQKS